MSGLLLDTSILLFVVLQSRRIAPAVRRDMQRRRNFVSSISGLEFAIKAGAGKLTLPPPFVTDFASAFRTMLDDLGAELIDPSLEDFGRLARLPDVHRDPFDRILIAQALGRGLTVVTSDHIFRQYSGLDVLEI